MKKTLIVLIIISMVIIIFVGCDSKSIIPSANNKKVQDKGLKIMTTNYLLYGMTNSIVKDINTVEFMFKEQQDQWNFTFTDDSVNNVSKKDIFIYTGGSFEPWIGDFVGSLNKSRVTILDVTRGTKIISRNEPVKFVYKNKEQQVSDNPYYWLDVSKYKTAIFNIAKSIEDKDPKNKSYYEKNFHANIKEVNSYDKKLKAIHKELKDYTFVVQGDDLDYLTRYLGLKIIKIPKAFDYQTESKDMIKNIEVKAYDQNKLVFLYDNDKSLKDNEIFIKEFKMQLSKICVYEYQKNYIDILKANCESLGKIQTTK